jgi:hypothetical protein
MPTEPVLHSFAYALAFLREQVSDVPDADLASQPPGVPNHPAWTLGHLAFTAQMLGHVVGVPPWLPHGWARQFAPGTSPVGDRRAYPQKDELLAILDDARARLVAAVAALPPERLDVPFPDPAYLDVFPTVRHALTQILVGHTAYHVGQVGAWRRAMGFPPLSRSFE